MKRPWMVAAALLVGGTAATGCSGSPSAAPTSSTTSSTTFSGTALAWLSAEGRPWNKKLNEDQAVVVRDSATTAEAAASAFFSRLATACTQLRDDAEGAQHAPDSPSASLNAAWQGMATHTRTYASDCLTVTRTHAAADLNRWNSSLQAMNSANGALNAAVATVRGVSPESAG